MIHLEIAKMYRNAGGSCVCLTDNAAVYSTTDSAFLAIAVKSASDVQADNSGCSADKLTAKNLVGTVASTLSASAQFKPDALVNKSVSKALNSGLNFYIKAASTRKQNVYNVMVTNSSAILLFNFSSSLQIIPSKHE